MERVLPEIDLRQWVLTFPFAWRRRLAQDGALLATLTRLFVDTVQRFYAERTAAHSGGSHHDHKTSAVTVIQRTSTDLRLNPHLHVVMAIARTSANARSGPLAAASRPTHHKHLRRHGLLENLDPDTELQDAEDHLGASAVSGQAPPAGPQWRRGLSPLRAAPLGYDKPLCASPDGFTLHAATRAGALDPRGREKLLCYVLRPPIAHRRIEHWPDGLVRIALKRAFAVCRHRAFIQ